MMSTPVPEASWISCMKASTVLAVTDVQISDLVCCCPVGASALRSTTAARATVAILLCRG